MLDLPSLGSEGVSVGELMPKLGEMVSRCLESGNPILGQHINEADCGLMANATPIREKGQVQGVICIFQELGQFETAAHGLESYKRISRQWETVFKASSDGIWVCNGDGVVIDVNAASEALNGIKAGDVIGKPMSGLIKEGLFDRSVTLEVLDTRRQVSVMQFIGRTGRYLLATGTPVLDEDGSILLVVVNERDITQLNAMREELARTQQMTEKIRDELAGLSLRELRDQQIVAESDNMRQILQVALKLARLDTTNVLITGESGTGKGLLAKFIHQSSARRREPFIQINCAALPENLLEAELFGYEKGAFTGASEKGKVGLFELANGGTLFLDEIGDMPLSLQAKLLKYLDDREILRLGGIRSRTIDCSILAATNQPLEELVRRKQFRRDLYYRLSVFVLSIPPIRERPEDAFELTRFFLNRYNKRYRMKKQIRQEGLEAIQAHPFSGNVRELKNLIKQAVVISEGRLLDPYLRANLTPARGSSPGTLNPAAPRHLSVEMAALEKRILKEAKNRCRTTREMARWLSVSQPTVVRKLKAHGLSEHPGLGRRKRAERG
jgi:PAS domain S-box-containing protein